MDRKTAVKFTPVYELDVREYLSSEFTRLTNECYLDHAGATLYSKTQINKVVNDLNSALYGNPHSAGSASSSSVHDIIERTRFRILKHFHTSTKEYDVIFTSGATASLKTVAETFNFKNNGDKKSGYFVYAQDNHTSVLGMREVVKRNGATVISLDRDKLLKIFSEDYCVSKKNVDEADNNSLFVYSAQCNFSGFKCPLSWIEAVENGILNKTIFGEYANNTRWYTFLDAASFAATNDLDLSIYKPDFVCLSFYKMFGYPTGIGALLVKNSSARVLEKVYYGGGTVEISLSSNNFHVKRQVLHERFEDGTIPFLAIVSLQYGFDELSKISQKVISQHVFSLAQYLYSMLASLRHSNRKAAVVLYADTQYNDCDNMIQGGIVSFNLMRSDGSYIGYMQVLHMAALYNIHLRTGCFCNPGACQRHLRLSNEEVLKNYDAGYICGGKSDLIDGKPTGAIRVSFGYMSTVEDVQKLLAMIDECFLEKNLTYTRILKDTEKTRDIVTASELSSPRAGALPRLLQLFVYPVKSCAAFEVLDSWTITPRGLQYDREWMIVTASGASYTQKHQSALCLIKPCIKEKENALELHYPGMPLIRVPLRYSFVNDACLDKPMCHSRVCGHGVNGTDCGSEVAEWLSLALRRPGLRLLRKLRETNENERIESGSSLTLSFSSQSQYLLINRESLKWLADRIPHDSDCNVETLQQRFRGNFIISCERPFQECEPNQICVVGINEFKVKGPCTRCQMICVDQTTSRKTVEPLRTLAKEFKGKISFGVYLDAGKSQTNVDAVVQIGDPIYFS
ncbi:molybdenum cofactor sulfurase 3 isoform X2 [Cephus cinctus]|uniref:Molybdenum cofactor sulfurase n=1 Tax=Cephus cinctus TaxID=211228 RepID=A0AAJ7RU32_CEPCN|nr:molybdenum cofactor sulfurase 3 isoform X2 [Cephus cinctus]